jgi:hypothetical protein
VNTLDWQCSACDAIQELSGFTSKNPPTCASCPAGNSMEILWRRSRISAWEQPLKYWDEDGKECVAKSIADIRSFEKEQERKARDGTGKLMVARDFSRDHNNMLDPVMERPNRRPNLNLGGGRRIQVRRGFTPKPGEHREG